MVCIGKDGIHTLSSDGPFAKLFLFASFSCADYRPPPDSQLIGPQLQLLRGCLEVKSCPKAESVSAAVDVDGRLLGVVVGWRSSLLMVDWRLLRSA